MSDSMHRENKPLPSTVVTVVTTLLFPRENPVGCLQSWTEGQDLPGDQIAMIVAVNGYRRKLEKEVETVLRPTDRMLFVESRNEMEMYDAAIRSAESEWVMIIEPHCTAESGCLRSLLEYVRSRNLAGACVRTLPSQDRTRTERAETRMYQESIPNWDDETEWRRITKRGVLLRRSCYLDVGGFDYTRFRFAETVLAARFREAGYFLGFASYAGIYHQNSKDLRELLSYVWEYRREERRFLAEEPGMLEEEASAFDGDPELSEILILPEAGETAKRALRGTCRELILDRSLARRKRFALKLLRLRFSLARGQRSRQSVSSIFLTAVEFLGAWFRFQMASGEESIYRAYQQIWQGFGDLSLLTESPSPPRAPESGVASPVESNACHWKSPCFSGFHALETVDGISFRWSSVLSLVRVPRTPPPSFIVFHLLDVRPLDPHEIYVWYQGHRLPFLSELSSRQRWVFRSPPESSRPPEELDFISLICPPFLVNSHEESRSLGLAIRAVTWEDSQDSLA